MKRTIITLSTIGGIALMLIVLSFLFWKKINKDKYEIAVINNQIQNHYKNDTAVSKLRKIVSGAQDDQQLLAGHFLRKSQTVDFLNGLEDLGTSIGATASINDVSVGKENKSLNVSISVRGTYQSVYSYFYLLENLPYLVNITSFNVNSEGSHIDPVTKIQTAPYWNGSIYFTILSYSDTD